MFLGSVTSLFVSLSIFFHSLAEFPDSSCLQIIFIPSHTNHTHTISWHTLIMRSSSLDLPGTSGQVRTMLSTSTACCVVVKSFLQEEKQKDGGMRRIAASDTFHRVNVGFMFSVSGDRCKKDFMRARLTSFEGAEINFPRPLLCLLWKH